MAPDRATKATSEPASSGGLDAEALQTVRDTCAQAVRAELSAGLGAVEGTLRRVVREELDRDDSDESDEDEETSAEEEDDAETSTACPKGHELERFDTPHEQFSCDICRVSLKQGDAMWGCRKCDYDVCEACFPPKRAPRKGKQEYKMIICVRHDLAMSVGKTGAQVGHAVHHAITSSRWRDIQAWERAGSKKVTLKVDSEEQLRAVQKAARKRGLEAHSIQDAGHTEVAAGTTTVLAIGPALADEVDKVTGDLRPLPDRVQQLERENKKLRDRAERLQNELDAAKKKAKEKPKRIYDLMRAASRVG